MDPVVELARVPRRPPRIDVVLAAAFLVWAGLEAALVQGPGPGWARAATALAFTIPLVWRRREPILVLAFVLAVLLLRAALADEPELGAMPFPVLLVGTFSAALYARSEALAVLGALAPPAAIFGARALGYFEGDPTATDLAVLCFFSAGAWTAGWLVRRRAAQVRQARAAGPELAREAVAEERARVARELHDVVAHSVSIIAVQAAAAEGLVAREPAQAAEHMAAVRRTAREALVELRRLVGVLREDEATYAPQPGLERMDELVAEARAAGLSVDLREEGARPVVPPGVDLAAYRIVQESLTNVRRHAGPVDTRVRVRYLPDGLDLEVANAAGPGEAGRSEGSGHGVIGMRERARLYGGTLEADPLDDGGFRVRAQLPLEGSGA